jgi:hypothetical protein
MTGLPTYGELKTDAMDRFVARLVKYGISEAEGRQRLEAAWNGHRLFLCRPGRN